MQFSIATKELTALGGACDIADILLKDGDPDGSYQIRDALTELTTVSRQVIFMAAMDLASMRAQYDNQALNLTEAQTDLANFTPVLQNYRGMLEKIVRMKQLAGGRNSEAALAAESFLAQNPVAV